MLGFFESFVNLVVNFNIFLIGEDKRVFYENFFFFRVLIVKYGIV